MDFLINVFLGCASFVLIGVGFWFLYDIQERMKENKRMKKNER